MEAPAQDRWLAPHAAGPVRATVRIPGSKSITNRALVLAALADDPTTVRRPLVARDTRLMVAGLRALGVDVTQRGDRIDVVPGRLSGPADIDCGLAGTVMRFLPPVAALAEGIVAFDGDPRARMRPMRQTLSALRQVGVHVEPDTSALPFRIIGKGSVAGGAVTIDASSSSQFVSGLLLAGARYDDGVDVRHVGKPLPSLPHIAMTLAMLRERGVAVDDDEPNRWLVSPGPVAAVDVDVEPDLSNAAPFLAAALVTGGAVTVAGWPASTTQPGDRLREIFEQFGAEVRLDDAGLTVRGHGTISAVDLDLHDVGELTPVVAAVAAVADGPSHLRGVGHLRGHETDRLAALDAELSARGCAVTLADDGLSIRPRPLAGGIFHTCDDHRIAQAAAVLGLVVPGLELDDIETASKTYEGFAAAWAAMLG